MKLQRDEEIKDKIRGALRTPLRLELLLFIISFIISLPLLNDYPANVIDEGIFLHGAVRLLKGEVPYRDFWHITLPGAIWIYAIVFKILGDKFIIARLTGCLFIIGQSILLYKIGRKITENSFLSFCASITYFLYIIIMEANCEPHIISVFFLLLAFYIYLYGKSNWKIFLAGIAIGSSTMAQQNLGAAGAVAILIILLVEDLRSRINIRGYLIKVIVFSLGLGLVFIPFIIYLILTHSVSPAIYTLLYWPFSNYVGFNKYPYLYGELLQVKNWYISHGPSFHLFIDITPLIIIGFLPVIVIPALFYTAIKEKNFLLLSIVLFATILQISVVLLSRPDYLHILFIAPPYFVLYFYELNYFGIKIKNSSRKLSSLIVLLLLLIPLILSFVRWSFLYKSRAFSPEFPINTERGIVSLTYKTPLWISDVIQYIEDTTEKYEPIFVYHWSPEIYFLTARKNPTPFDTYIPIYNTEEQMDKIIEAIKGSRPRLVIKDSYIEPWQEDHPNRLMFPNVDWTTLLDKDPVNKYIENNYVYKGKIGSFKIYTLRE